MKSIVNLKYTYWTNESKYYFVLCQYTLNLSEYTSTNISTNNNYMIHLFLMKRLKVEIFHGSALLLSELISVGVWGTNK